MNIMLKYNLAMKVGFIQVKSTFKLYYTLYTALERDLREAA